MASCKRDTVLQEERTAEKDIAEKILMSYADVFADCMNALAYEGRRQLRAEALQPAPTESFYRGKGRLRNQFCDRSFYRMKEGQTMAQYIIENETRLRRRQILRKMSYQGGAYREQLPQKGPAYPVICIVMDWKRKGSQVPTSLRRLVAGSGASREELLMMDDAKLQVYYMRNLPRKVRERFVSDMGFVADYLNEGSLEGRQEQRIVHLQALCEMMETITGDARFTEQLENLLEKERKGEGIRMCEYLDMLEARGQKRGEEIGQKRGEKIGQKRGEKIGQKRGKKIGEKVGQERGENRLASLINNLLKEKKYREIEEVSNDHKRRQELYRQYGIL